MSFWCLKCFLWTPCPQAVILTFQPSRSSQASAAAVESCRSSVSTSRALRSDSCSRSWWDLSKPFAQPSFDVGIGCRPKNISTERSERLWNPHLAATQTAKLLQQIGTVAFADYQLHSHGLGALGPNPRFWNALCRNPRCKAIPLNPNLSIPRKKLKCLVIDETVMLSASEWIRYD